MADITGMKVTKNPLFVEVNGFEIEIRPTAFGAYIEAKNKKTGDILHHHAFHAWELLEDRTPMKQES